MLSNTLGEYFLEYIAMYVDAVLPLRIDRSKAFFNNLEIEWGSSIDSKYKGQSLNFKINRNPIMDKLLEPQYTSGETINLSTGTIPFLFLFLVIDSNAVYTKTTGKQKINSVNQLQKDLYIQRLVSAFTVRVMI